MKSKIKKIRVVLAGGGTAGHIFPLGAVAVKLAETIRTRGAEPEIRYYGDPGPFHSVLENAGVEIRRITSSKWRRYFDLANLLDIFRFIWSFKQSLWKILWFMPDVCFSKGGPGSFAVVAACRFYGIPIVVHESDAVIGLSNRTAAQYAKLVEFAFPGGEVQLSPGKLSHVVGNPVREEIIKSGECTEEEKRAARIEFGLETELPVILFLGGSQGAEKLNEFLLENIESFISRFQILHQTGAKNYESHKQQFEFLYREGRAASIATRYKFAPFFDRNLVSAYQAADVVAARAGAGLIFEIAAIGKPSILIPLPTSARNHQRENAYVYAKTGAAEVIEEENLLPALFMNEAEKILKSPARLQTMRDAARKFAVPNSAELIAEDIVEIAIGKK